MQELFDFKRFQKLDNKKEIDGCVFLQDYVYKKPKAKEFFEGTILIANEEIGFISWENNDSFKKLKENNFFNTPIFIKSKIDVSSYGKRLNILDIEIAEDKFLNKNSYFSKLESDDSFLNFLKDTLSPKGFNLFSEIARIEDTDGLYQKFILNNSYVLHCLELLKFMVNQKVQINNFSVDDISNEDFKDLLYIGSIFHYIENKDSFSFLFVFDNNKDFIIENYNFHFYELLSKIIDFDTETQDKILIIIIDFIRFINEVECKMDEIDDTFNIDEGISNLNRLYS